MTEFDIESLFANIPLEEKISACVAKVFNQNGKVKEALKHYFT